ncbi:MAG: RHS repeat-associated core domain-containing protein [Dysgonamonadaceae bacterium]|nr:RHS repeat-associated core domain-containing protein [Dysgonamonadaceae bacterium]
MAKKIIFAGDMERVITGNVTRDYYYISGGDGLAAIYVKAGTSGTLHRVITDHLGSIVRIIGSAALTTSHKAEYDAWGRRKVISSSNAFTDFHRGYTGHEHLKEFGLINTNGRLYDPQLARFLQPDPFVQFPDNSQTYNRYSYCLNNPLKYTDPSGENPLIILGLIVGAYMGGVYANEGQLNPVKWDYSLNSATYYYVLQGGILGALSSGIGGGIASSGIPMANTASIAAASLTYSLGNHVGTGGQMPISTGFGVASYDLTNGTFGYLGKKGNKWYQNVGYGLGAAANASDILAGFKPGDVTLRTENDPEFSPIGDPIGHSQIEQNGNVLIDWGPNNYAGKLFNSPSGTNSYSSLKYPDGLIPNLKGGKFWDPINIKGVNLNTINTYKNLLDKGGQYQLLINSCVSQTSRALNLSGVFNLGILPGITHPYWLHTQMYLWSNSIRPWTYSYFLYH